MFQFSIMHPGGIVDYVFTEDEHDTRTLIRVLSRLVRNGVFQSFRVEKMKHEGQATDVTEMTITRVVLPIPSLN